MTVAERSRRSGPIRTGTALLAAGVAAPAGALAGLLATAIAIADHLLEHRRRRRRPDPAAGTGTCL